MSLSAASALPLQTEKTDKRKREARMPLSKYFKPKDSEMQNSLAAKSDSQPPARPMPQPPAKGKKRMTLGQRIAAKD